MRLTQPQIRILINAAIDASPSSNDEEEGAEEQRTPEQTEHDRRVHRQLLRKRGIKPSHVLAERMRKPPEEVLKGYSGKNRNNKILRNGKPTMGKTEGANNVGDLLKFSNVSVSGKARRLLELGGY